MIIEKLVKDYKGTDKIVIYDFTVRSFGFNVFSVSLKVKVNNLNLKLLFNIKDFDMYGNHYEKYNDLVNKIPDEIQKEIIYLINKD